MAVPQEDSQNNVQPPESDPPSGGSSAEQIERNARQDLVQIARELERVRERMLSDAAPALPEVQEWVRQARGRLGLLLGPDMSVDVREAAAQLDAWLQILPETVPAWETIRTHRAEVQALRDAIAALGDQRATLREPIAALAELAPPASVVDLKTALAAVPSRKSIEPVRVDLQNRVRETRATLQEVRDRADRARTEPIDCAAPADAPLCRQLQAEAGAAASAARRARRAAAAFLGEIKPLLNRAELESQAAQRLDDWRHYLDRMADGRALEAWVAELGAAGIHAFFIEDASGVCGPFQFEQAIAFGIARAAVRSIAPNRVRLIDVPTVRLLGRSDAGMLVVPRPGPEGGAGELVTVRLTARWDDLAARLQFLLRETAQILERLAEPPPACASWCAQALRVLADRHVMRRIREEHRIASDRWRSLWQDLHALGSVKARIEMWNLVRRLLEVVPRVRQRLLAVRGELAAGERDLAELIVHCTRDAASGQLLAPPALAARFTAAKAKRDRAAAEVAKLENLLKQLGAQVARQFAGGANAGTSQIPPFRALPGFTPDLRARVIAMTDEQLAKDVSQLEIALNMPVRGQSGNTAREDGSRTKDKGLPADQCGCGDDSCSPSIFSGS